MLTNTNSQLINSTTYAIDFLVDAKVFDSLKERITDQYLKNIDIPGFRKGNAPKEKTMAKADLPYLENLVWNEIIMRNYNEAEKTLREKTDSESRNILSISLSQDADTIGESDKGFKFRLVANLLPKIDLSKVDQITVKEPTEKDIPTRMTLDEFVAKEKNILFKTFNEFEETDKALTINDRATADVFERNITVENAPLKESKNVTLFLGASQFPDDFEKHIIGSKAGDTKEFIIKVESPNTKKIVEFEFKVVINTTQAGKYSSFEELFEKSTFLASSFGSQDSLIANLHETYGRETDSLIEDIKIRRSVTALVQNTDEIELNEEVITSEIERIYAELQKNSHPAEVFNNSAFPFVSVATDKNLKAEVTKYVRGEFKLSKICLAIYYEKVERKITEEELVKFKKEIESDPEKYGYPKELKGDDLKDRIFDNLIRNRSLEWLLKTIKFN
jgi:trigger factor